MNIISLVKDEQLSSRIDKAITSKFDIGVVSVHTIEDSVGIFNILDDIAAIIFDDHFSESLIEAAKENRLVIDFLYLGAGSISDEKLNLHCFDQLDSLVSFVSSNLSHPNSRFNVIDEKELYYPIISKTLVKMMCSPVDIYVRLKKTDYFYYIKFIDANDEFDEEQVRKISSLPRVFIKRESRSIFFEQMNFLLLSLLKKGAKEKSNLSQNDIRLEVFNQLISVGLSKHSVEVANAAIENIAQSSNKGLLKELNSVYSSDAPTNYRKSFLTSMLCTSIAKKLSWVNPSNIDVLILVSFFNDRLLVRDSMHFVEPGDDLELTDYSENEKNIILNHAKITADWAAKQKFMPPEAERIIRQHHGSVTGVGMKTNLNAQITKLSIIFLVAESFAMEILRKSDKKLSVVSCLEELSAKYNNHKHVKSTIEALFLALKSKA